MFMIKISGVAMAVGLLLASSVAFAENSKMPSKPTHAETVAFIKSTYPANRPFFLEFKGELGLPSTLTMRITEFEIEIIEENFCVLTVGYDIEGSVFVRGSERQTRNEHEFESVELHKIEEIEVGATGGGNNMVYGLYFLEKNKRPGEDVNFHLPLGVRSGNFQDVAGNIKNEKLYKAFNHLRKLCGAPDPVSFD